MTRLMKDAIKSRTIASKIEHDLSDLSDLVTLSEQLLKKQLQSLNRRINRETKKLKGYEKEYLIGWYSPDVIQLRDVFPKILRYSLFATIMTSVEANLIMLCHYMQAMLSIEQKFQKKSRNTDIINHSLEYLISKARIDAKRMSHDRENVVMFWRMRNCIIHSEGKITGEFSDAIKQYCEDLPTLGVDKHNYIILYEGFPGIALHVIRSLFLHLLRQINISLKLDANNEVMA